MIPLSSYYQYDHNWSACGGYISPFSFSLRYNKSVKVSVKMAAAYLRLLSKTKNIQNISLGSCHLNKDEDGQNSC